MSNGPSESKFAELAKRMPALLAGLGKRLMAARSESSRVVAGKFPCTICGKKIHTPKSQFVGVNTERDTHCRSCNKNLDAGYTALVTIDAKRYAFVKTPYLAHMKGKVMPIRNETMDAVEKEFEKTGWRPLEPDASEDSKDAN